VAEPAQDEPEPPSPRAGDLLGALRRDLWFLKKLNRSTIHAAESNVAAKAQILTRRAAELAELNPLAAKARQELEAVSGEAETARAALSELTAMESPTPQSIADEEVARRKLARLATREAELATTHENARAAMETAREGVERAELAFTRSQGELESWQMSAEASEFLASMKIRGLEHARTYPDTVAGRTLGIPSSDLRVVQTLAELHRHYAEQEAASRD
jgi:hypothetical protein